MSPMPVSLNSASFNTARLTGPEIAGVLIVWLGTVPVILLSAANFAALIISLAAIHASELAPLRRQFAAKAKLRRDSAMGNFLPPL